METNHPIRRRADVRFQVDGDQAYIVDEQRGQLLMLNLCGRAVWEEMADPVDPETLCARIAARFGMTAAEVREDVQEFLRKLAQENLIERGGAADVAGP